MEIIPYKGEAMKKHVPILLVFVLFAAPAFAQSFINAKDILKSLNEGKAIEYTGVEIIGNLDLTSIQDFGSSGFGKDAWHHVRSPLIFKDCIFTGDVIAYRNSSWGWAAHNVAFHENVSFHGCEFRGKSAFKYSKFYRMADFRKATYRKEALFKYADFFAQAIFSGSNFSNGANFKYAEFSTEVSFAASTFSNKADFKYTDFSGFVDFTRAKFHQSADFKYTEFPRGVCYRDCVFHGDANFKYTKFFEPFDFDGIAFENSADFKYAKLEGNHFVPSALQRRR